MFFCYINIYYHLFSVIDDNLYVATVAGFNGADPLIYRSPLRTEQFNPKHLNGNEENHIYNTFIYLYQ
jgi:hypothetical protein